MAERIYEKNNCEQDIEDFYVNKRELLIYVVLMLNKNNM